MEKYINPRKIKIFLFSIFAMILLSVNYSHVVADNEVRENLDFQYNLNIASTPDPNQPTFLIQAPVPQGVEYSVGAGNSYGGCRDNSIYLHCNNDHYAIDLNANDKIGPDADLGILVLAVADGYVIDVSKGTEGYGNTILIQHASGFQSRYAHLGEIFTGLEAVDLQGAPMWVPQGTPIGKIGNTGTGTAAHLHFAMYLHKKVYDPNQKKEIFEILASKPEPLGNATDFPDWQSGEIRYYVSDSYSTAYERMDYKAEEGELRYHRLIKEKYESLYLNTNLINPSTTNPDYNKGNIGLMGRPVMYVEEWDNQDYLYQEFGVDINSPFEWSHNYNSAILEIKPDNEAFFVAGPLWKKYKEEGGPTGHLGEPINDTYSWVGLNNLGLRSDFQNGSIIWYGSKDYEILEKSNSPWEAEFFNEPEVFSGDSVKRLDEAIHFGWYDAKNPGPILTDNGFSARWVAKNINLLTYTKYYGELQGHLEIFVDGKFIKHWDSPEKSTDFNTEFNFTVLPHNVEIRYWQDAGKQGSIKLFSKGLFQPAFADTPLATVKPQDAVFVDYYQNPPPPFPDSNIQVNPSPLPVGNVDSSTVMVLDTSGSMVEEDITGLSKLDAAKHAAGNIINIITSEAQQNNSVTTRLGLVNYNDYAVVNLGLTTDYASVQSELNNLWTTGGTGMAAGLQAGLDLFGTSNVNEKQMIILLSDGIANIPIDPALSYDIDGIKQEVIDLSSRAGSQGVCVYTVGFGVPGSYGTIDEQFLTDIASASGCGAYYNAQDSIQLANVFVELRHTSMGNLVFDQTGQIAQGEELDLGTVAIPTNQELALFTLNWPGSKLELNIQDPTGTAVDENYPGATFSLSPSIVSVVLSNPMPGDWRLGILGVDIPQGITTYNSVVSTRMGIATPLPPATPTQQAVTIPSGSGGTGMIIFLLVTASVAAMLFIYVQTKNRTKKAAFNSQLVGVSGLYAGRTIVVRDHFTIGRGAGSNLVLNDPKVSRKHVQLRFANDAWFIQDMESSAGTFVNGRRVNGQRLSNGDQIQIGNQAFTFRVGG